MKPVRGWTLIFSYCVLAGCQRQAAAPLPRSAPEQSKPVQHQATIRDRAPQQAISIPLKLSTIVEAPYAVSSGIPFPRGAATSLSHLRLETASGQEVPAQFAELARWPDGSYKSVLVSFTAEPFASIQAFRLQSGPAIATHATPSPLTWTEDRSLITVNTGPMRFAVSKSRFTLFEQVEVDANHNGVFEESERLLHAPGEIFLVNAFNGREYLSSHDTHPRVVIEEAGPLRVVIRASGTLRADDGDALTDFIVRLTATAGQDAVAVDYTLVDTREERDVEAKRTELALSVSGYGIRLPARVPDATGLFGGEHGQVYTGPAQGHPYLFQTGRFNYADGQLQPFEFFYEGVGEGAQADGWMDLSSAQAGVSAMVRHFWQQFPKELSLDEQQMTISLHPLRASTPKPDTRYPPLNEETKAYQRPNTLYFPREGGAKTYQLLFQFHPGKGEWSKLRALYSTFEASPRLLAPASWYCSSGVFGHLLEAGPDTEGYDAWLLDGLYQPSVGNAKSDGGLAMLYGWRDYGDRLRPGWAGVWGDVKIPGFYNDTHIGAHNFFIQYLRTLDDNWWELGEMATRHWMDIDVSHANRLGHWRQNGRLVGFGPGEGHLIKHEMIDHDDRNLHWGHAHLSGLPDYYLLTGDRRALEVLREVGDWWARAAPVFYPTPVSNPHHAEAERDFAWPLFVLNEAYRATGDARYLEAGAQIVRHLIGWWQTPSDHWVNGTLAGKNDWRRGTGWWYMYPRQDNSPDPAQGKILYNGTNPWMAGPLLSALIAFHEFDQDTHLVDDSLVVGMMLQTMNYVVKYGWEPDKWYFVYSEAHREGGSNMNLMVYPLAYLWKLLNAGGAPHPEWYDTASTWHEIASGAADDWRAVKSRENSNLGFYGYEFVFPADFFALMAELKDGASTHQ